MSWSFQAVGRPAAVAEKAKAEQETPRCAGAEEVARTAVLEAVGVLCREGFTNEHAVRVSASGSAYTDNGVQKYNSLELKVEPLYGFVE